MSTRAQPGRGGGDSSRTRSWSRSPSVRRRWGSASDRQCVRAGGARALPGWLPHLPRAVALQPPPALARRSDRCGAAAARRLARRGRAAARDGTADRRAELSGLRRSQRVRRRRPRRLRAVAAPLRLRSAASLVTDPRGLLRGSCSRANESASGRGSPTLPPASRRAELRRRRARRRERTCPASCDDAPPARRRTRGQRFGTSTATRCARAAVESVSAASRASRPAQNRAESSSSSSRGGSTSARSRRPRARSARPGRCDRARRDHDRPSRSRSSAQRSVRRRRAALEERPKQVDRRREDDRGRVASRRSRAASAGSAAAARSACAPSRRAASFSRSRRLELALGGDHLRAPLALGLGLAGHRALHARPGSRRP